MVDAIGLREGFGARGGAREGIGLWVCLMWVCLVWVVWWCGVMFVFVCLVEWCGCLEFMEDGWFGDVADAVAIAII